MPGTINIEQQNKSAQRFLEKVEDNTKLIAEAFFDSPPIKFLSDYNTSIVAPSHSNYLLNEVYSALKNNDLEEAAHQLKRDVDFCNMVPKMIGSPYQKTALAGMQALKEHKSAMVINQEMDKAWQDAWSESGSLL